MPMQMGFRWYGEGNDKIKLLTARPHHSAGPSYSFYFLYPSSPMGSRSRI